MTKEKKGKEKSVGIVMEYNQTATVPITIVSTDHGTQVIVTSGKLSSAAYSVPVNTTVDAAESDESTE